MVFRLFKGKQKKKAALPYHEWVVKDIIHNTTNTISVVFDANSTGGFPYRSGQFVTLIAKVNGKEVRRPYSLCTSPFADNDLAVTIKRVNNGLLSNHLLDTLKKGDTLKVIKPAGQFGVDYDKHSQRHLIMFAGGVGITPLFSMLKSAMHQEPDSIVSLLYCNKDVENIIFKDNLDILQSTYAKRLRVAYALDDPPIAWQGYSGMLDQTIFSRFMKYIPNWGWDKTLFFLCGPKGMMDNVEAFLEAHAAPKEKIFKENFSPSGAKQKTPAEPTLSEDLKTRSVTILHEGNKYTLDVKSDQTILEAALEEGLDVPFSCQSGMCTACRGKALSGKVKMDEEEGGGGLSQEEYDEGYVLPCVGHPLTDDVVIEIG